MATAKTVSKKSSFVSRSNGEERKFAVGIVEYFFDDVFEKIRHEKDLESAIRTRDTFNNLCTNEQIAVVVLFEPRFADGNAWESYLAQKKAKAK
jgi:hypothetical protein